MKIDMATETFISCHIQISIERSILKSICARAVIFYYILYCTYHDTVQFYICNLTSLYKCSRYYIRETNKDVTITSIIISIVGLYTCRLLKRLNPTSSTKLKLYSISFRKFSIAIRCHSP